MLRWTITLCVIATVGPPRLGAQEAADEHMAVAKLAAGEEHEAVFTGLCTPVTPHNEGMAPSPPPPARAQWYADPVKVFDNLYWVGEQRYSAWAVTTSEGIIIIDALWDYSVEGAIVDGLEKLGLDPETIRYVIVSHGHSDHAGGAHYLQERFGAQVIVSAADWDLLENDPRETGDWPRPNRDLIATDGQELTLGGTTLTLYQTPGHTLGTMSTLVPVADDGEPHLAVLWGGTGFNWLRQRDRYITPDTPYEFWFETYAASAERLRSIALLAGADVLLSNHPGTDGSLTKLPALQGRQPGAPHPYVVGSSSVRNFLTVVEECAKAGLERLR